MSPNVLFRMTCGLFHVPRFDNNIRFTVLNSNGNRITRARFDSGSSPESRTFARREALPETTTVLLQVRQAAPGCGGGDSSVVSIPLILLLHETLDIYARNIAIFDRLGISPKVPIYLCSIAFLLALLV